MHIIKFRLQKEIDSKDSELIKFFKSLEKKDMEKLSSVIMKIEQCGIDIGIKMKWVKKLDDNLFEIRSKQSSNIQRVIYFHIYDTEFGSHYIMTHGFTKKTNKTPKCEIDKGIKIRTEFLSQSEKTIKKILRLWLEGDKNE